MMAIEAFDEEIPGHVRKLPWLERRLAHRSFRLVVNTAIGKTFRVKPDAVLGAHIRKLFLEKLEPSKGPAITSDQ